MTTKTQDASPSIPVPWPGLVLLLCALLVPSRAAAAGTWTPLVNTAPGSVWFILLLSDGTVLAGNNPVGIDACCQGNGWFRLTPDGHGSYINGNWTTLNSANDTRLFFSSEVLRDGRVFVAGGEYGSGYGTAEIFDPVANGGAGYWAYINPPTSLLDPSQPSPILLSGNQGFIDSISKVLPSGNVMVAPVGAKYSGETLIYDPVANTWSAGATTASVYQDEASWVKLPDESILTIDPYGQNSERYIPSNHVWLADAPVPVPMYDTAGSELGAALLLPDGRAFFLGASGHTVLYTPSGNTNQGTWAQGPDIPGNLAAQDAPAAMMVNGKILCAVGPKETQSGGSPGPTSFFEYNYASGPTGAFTQVSGPTGTTDSVGSGQIMMLDLPDGNVLYAHVEQNNFLYNNFGSQLYVYTPDGSPLPAGKPTISSVTLKSDGSYHLVGTGLNGISEGAAFGDDAQMNSNYPLVRMTDLAGNVFYARTYNWSSTGVQTGSRLVSTEFTVPFGAGGPFSLVVVANGIASDPVTFYGPVWVDFAYSGPQNGSFQEPFETLGNGVTAVAIGGTISINAANQPSTSSETMTISKPMTITSFNGLATIGQ